MSEEDGRKAELSAPSASTIHDATNALTVVLGWIERAAMDDADRSDALARASHHARWARDRLRSLLGASTGESSLEPRLGTSTVADLLRRTSDDLAVEAARESLAIDVRIDATLRERKFEAPVAAWQVLTNLVLNAIGASRHGGRVTLSADPIGQARIRISVDDEGAGVPLERRARLFSGGESTRTGGAGVGLRSSYALAIEHGGSLAFVEKETPGSTFVVEWPLTSNATQGALQGLRILLLEDDRAVQELLELSLVARGAEVRAVSDTVALERALATVPCDVLLLDLSPLANGGDAHAELHRIAAVARTTRPGTVILSISGSSATLGPSDVRWLRKPFTPGELIDAIEQSCSDRAGSHP